MPVSSSLALTAVGSAARDALARGGGGATGGRGCLDHDGGTRHDRWLGQCGRRPQLRGADGSARWRPPGERRRLAGVATLRASYITVTAGAAHSCAVRDGAERWPAGAATRAGRRRRQRAPSPRWRSSGAAHSCAAAVRSVGSLACWGSDDSRPGDAAPAGTFTAGSGGSLHSCGVHIDGTLQAPGPSRWGRDFGTWRARPPCSVPGKQRPQLRGADDTGRWPVGAATSTARSSPPDGTFDIGERRPRSTTVHGAANGTLACWGSDVEGQASPPDGTFTAVGAGGDHSCAVRMDGALACWVSTLRARLRRPTAPSTASLWSAPASSTAAW